MITNTRICFPRAYTVELEELPVGAPLEPNQVLIRNIYTLISPGTELALFTGTHLGLGDPNNLWAKFPFYPGYAAVGRIEALGGNVHDLVLDELVYHQGTHESYSLATRPDVLPVRNDIPLPWIPFARFCQISNSALLACDVRQGDVVVVIGLGLIGNLAAQLFGTRGASVIGIDPVGARRELARQAGIEATLDPSHQDLERTVMAMTGEQGARIVVEATGNPDLIASALRVCQIKGQVIILGGPRGMATLDVYNLIQCKGISLKGVHETLFPDSPAARLQVAAEMLEQIREKRLRVEHLVSGIVRPAQLVECYRALLTDKDRSMTFLVDWTD